MGKDHVSLVLWQLHVYSHRNVHMHAYLLYTRTREYILTGTYAAAHLNKHGTNLTLFVFFPLKLTAMDRNVVQFTFQLTSARQAFDVNSWVSVQCDCRSR
jgi:hypothetical protein